MAKVVQEIVQIESEVLVKSSQMEQEVFWNCIGKPLEVVQNPCAAVTEPKLIRI